MNAPLPQDWTIANQQLLVAEFARLKQRLQAATAMPADPQPAIAAARNALRGASAIDWLADTFGLSAFERDLRLLCAGVRQGADVGTQYRSAIFYHNDEQQRIATDYKARLNASGAFRSPIVTEIVRADVFYPAEDYHQNYYALNGNEGYCHMVIRPKLDKFRKVFAEKLKR